MGVQLMCAEYLQNGRDIPAQLLSSPILSLVLRAAQQVGHCLPCHILASDLHQLSADETVVFCPILDQAFFTGTF